MDKNTFEKQSCAMAGGVGPTIAGPSDIEEVDAHGDVAFAVEAREDDHACRRGAHRAGRVHGDDLQANERRRVLLRARKNHPRRWTGDVRTCTPVGAVALNPVRETAYTNALAREI